MRVQSETQYCNSDSRGFATMLSQNMAGGAKGGWGVRVSLVLFFALCPQSRADPVGPRTRYAAVGLNGGYVLFKNEYGGELLGKKIEKEHWYGGGFGGIEAGLMWPVGNQMDLGARFKLDGGNLRTTCETITCAVSIDDCVCEYSERFVALNAITAVLAVSVRDWVWLEAQLGFFLWIDGNSFALEPNLLWAGAVGFNLIGDNAGRLFIRLEIDGAWRTAGHFGLIPQAAIGVRF